MTQGIQSAVNVRVSSGPLRHDAGGGYERKAILVLGMHRSGTSALAGLLTNLGCDGPATLMAPTPMNPKGYFESDAIYRLHEEIFISAATSWDDFRPFPLSWLRSPKALEYRSRMQDLIASEYGGSSLFVLKDPRICRMVPFWIDLLEDMGIQPLAVHTHRNPLEVSTSLTERDQIDPDYGQFLWLGHVLEAEYSSRNIDRVFTSYNCLIENWTREVKRIGDTLGVSWPKFSRSNNLDVASFIERKLKNFNFSPDFVKKNEILSKLIVDAYSIFENWVVAGPQVEDFLILDAIRAQYASGAETFGPLIHSRGKAIRTDRDNVRRKLSEMEAASTGQAQKIESLMRENASLRDEAGRLQDALAQQAADGSRARAELADKEVQLAGQSQELRDLNEEYDRTVSALVKCQSEIEKANGLRSQLTEARQALMQGHERFHQVAHGLSALGERIGVPGGDAAAVDAVAALVRLERGVDDLLYAQNIADDKLRQANAAVEGLRNSISWRITGPLRWLARGFRRGIDKGVNPA